MDLHFLRSFGLDDTTLPDVPRGTPGKSTLTSRLAPTVVIRIGEGLAADVAGPSRNAPVQMRRDPTPAASVVPLRVTEPVDDPFGLHLSGPAAAPSVPVPTDPPLDARSAIPTAGAAALSAAVGQVQAWATRAVPPNEVAAKEPPAAGNDKPPAKPAPTTAPQAKTPATDPERKPDQTDGRPPHDAQPVQKLAATDHESPDLHHIAARGASGASHALPFLDRIQASFGRHDVGSIRAHTGREARDANQRMESLAYASDGNVVFGRDPDLFTAAHEAAHVIQQRRGVSLSGGVGASDDGYERHADAVADAVVRGESAERLLDELAGGGGGGGSGAVQHKKNAPPPPPSNLSSFRVKPEFMGAEPFVPLVNIRDWYFAAAEGSYDQLTVGNNLKSVDAAWATLMTAYDAGCAKIAQTLAAALSSKDTVLDGQARDSFQRMTDGMAQVQAQVKVIRGITRQAGGLGTQLDGVEDEQEATQLAIKQAKSDEEREALEAKLKEQQETAEKWKAAVEVAAGTLVKIAQGKPLEAVEAFLMGVGKAATSVVLDEVFVDSQLKEKVSSIKTEMTNRAASIRALSQSAASKQIDGIESTIQGLDEEKAGANIALQHGARMVSEEIDDLKNLKGKENAAIATVFSAIDGYVASVGPKGEAVRAALDSVRLPPKQPIDTQGGIVPSDPRRAVKPPNIAMTIAMINRTRAEVKQEWEDEWSAYYDDKDDPRQKLLDQKMAAWDSEAVGVASWLAQIEAWDPSEADEPVALDFPKVEKELTYKRTFIAGEHLAKKDEAIRIIQSEILPRTIP